MRLFLIYKYTSILMIFIKIVIYFNFIDFFWLLFVNFSLFYRYVQNNSYSCMLYFRFIYKMNSKYQSKTHIYHIIYFLYQ